MKRYDRVVEILQTAVNGESISAHRNFWLNKPLDQFTTMKVFGQRVVVPGDVAASNLVNALRGLTPFGADLDPPPDDAIFDRMPLGRPAVPELEIQFIEKWIADGCPDDAIPEPPKPLVASIAVATAGPDDFVRFFREFDQFFAFDASDQTTDAINEYFPVARQSWPGLTQAAHVPAWTAAISDANVKTAIKFLSDNQLRVIAAHFGDPPNATALNDALWLFGKGTLPADDQRPQDRFHRMNGASMWLMWLAFADASLRLGMATPQWTRLARSVCLGMVGDALFRTDRPPNTRLKITRYRADDPDLQSRVIGDFAKLSDAALLDAVISLGREARFGAPPVG